MYKIKRLNNGLRLIIVPMSGTKTATILVMVGTGSKYETRKNSGISHFLEHMFFKGTVKRPNTLIISSILDGIGAEFNAFTGKETTGYWVKAAADKIELALDVVSDMLFNSKFDSREIEREKGVIIEELNMYLDNPMMRIEDVYEELLYGDTPAGRDTIGTRKTISNMKREDFIKYLNAQYTINNTVVCLAGDINNQVNIERLVEKYFSNNKLTARGNDFKEKIAVEEVQARPAIKMEYKKTDQAHLALGVRTFGYDHRDKLIAKMIAIILGGSMSSRMFINLRERQGLAYYIRTEAEVYTDSGYIATRAGVPVDKIETAIKTILLEYKKIKTVLVDGKELQRTKDLLFGRSAIQFESSDNIADWYTRQAVMIDTVKRTQENYKEKVVSPASYLKEVKAITTSDIRRVARKIFTNKGLNLAIVGPYRDSKRFESILKF